MKFQSLPLPPHTHNRPLSVCFTTICWMFRVCKLGETGFKRLGHILKTLFSQKVKWGGSGTRGKTAEASVASIITSDSLWEKKQHIQSISCMTQFLKTPLRLAIRITASWAFISKIKWVIVCMPSWSHIVRINHLLLSEIQTQVLL